MTLFDLREVRQSVVFRTRAVVLKAIADETRRTSHIFARSGSDMLTPDAQSNRCQRIEALADAIGHLAIEAEQGSGSYQQFEAVLAKLHQERKFPESSAVSAVARAFTE